MKNKKLCKCGREICVRGMCKRCYKKWRYHNNPKCRKRVLESTKKYSQRPKIKKAKREKDRIWYLKYKEELNEQRRERIKMLKTLSPQAFIELVGGLK